MDLIIRSLPPEVKAVLILKNPESYTQEDIQDTITELTAAIDLIQSEGVPTGQDFIGQYIDFIQSLNELVD